MRGDFFNWWGGDSGALWRRWVVLLLQCVDVEARDKSGVWEREGGLSRLTDYSDLHWKQF